MKTTRTYEMRARADAMRASRERMLDAWAELCFEIPIANISLDDVANRAGVSVPTILRHFGSKAGLADACVEYMGPKLIEARAVLPDDPGASLRGLLDEYEAIGNGVLLMLAQEETDPEHMGPILIRAKAIHRQWVTETFKASAADAGAIDLLVVATDIYTWKLLRRDRGHSREETETLMRRLVDAILKEP